MKSINYTKILTVPLLLIIILLCIRLGRKDEEHWKNAIGDPVEVPISGDISALADIDTLFRTEIFIYPQKINGLEIITIIESTVFQSGDVRNAFVNYKYKIALSNGDTLRFDDYPSDEVLVMLYCMERENNKR